MKLQAVRNSTLHKTIRGGWNSFLHNSLFSSAYDRIVPPRSLGVHGERVAERFLLKSGYIVVGRSYSDAIGELDLIAIDGRTVVFVEVKTRSSDSAGAPAEAVDEDKQIRISKTAISYLKRHDLLDCKSRFDVIAISWPRNGAAPELEHYMDAFAALGVD